MDMGWGIAHVFFLTHTGKSINYAMLLAMTRVQTIIAGISVVLVAGFLLYQFHYKDSMFWPCSSFSPFQDKAECLARGGNP